MTTTLTFTTFALFSVTGGNRDNRQHHACYTRARSCINSPPFPAIQHHPRSNMYVNSMPEFRNSQLSCRASSLACTPLRTVTLNSSSPSKVTCRTASEAPRSCRAHPRSTIRQSFSLLSPFRCHVDKTLMRQVPAICASERLGAVGF